MPQLPTLIGYDSLPQPTERVPTYDPNIIPRALESAGQNMAEGAAIERKLDIFRSMQDATQRRLGAEKQVTNLMYGDGTDQNPGLLSMQGANARGVSKTYSDAFDKIQSQALQGVQNPIAQRALMSELGQLNNTMYARVKEHEFTQSREYSANLLGQQVTQSSQLAALDPTNEQLFQQESDKAAEAAQQRARMLPGGPQPGDPVDIQNGIAARSQVAMSRLQPMYDSPDMSVKQQALALTDKALSSGQVDLDTIGKLNRLKSVVLPEMTAYKAFQDYRQQGGLASLTPTQWADAVQWQESKGKMIDPKTGGVLTSSTGAMGLMQIEPSSKGGPAGDLAKEMGVTEEQVLTDPKINRQAGELYLSQLEQKYGDRNLATLAYNWGPGRVDDHIEKVGDPRKGEIPMQNFLASVPVQQAREYVPSVLAGAGKGGGTINQKDAEDYAKTLPPYAQKSFMEYVSNANAQVAAARDMQNKQVMNKALDIYGQGKKWQDLPASIQASAASGGFADLLQKYDPKAPSDSSALGQLYAMAPDQFSKEDLQAPGTRLNLSQADYEYLARKQSLMTQNTAANETAQQIHAMMMTDAKKAGMPMHTTYDQQGIQKLEGGIEFVRAQQLVEQSIDTYSRGHNGQYPTAEQVRGIVDNVILNQLQLKGAHWWNGDQNVNKFDIALMPSRSAGANDKTFAIPTDEKETIVQQLKARGQSQTEAAIINAYISTKQRQ